MSSATKDPAIKLFGKTIALPECHVPSKVKDKSDVGCQIQDACSEIIKNEAEYVGFEESVKQDKSSVVKDCAEEDKQIAGNTDVGQVNLKPKEDTAETDSVDQEKVLKKPDKILPCPRCNSLDTKFCYFNNYNVNQPRHFCKACQRYWTAGGTVRNVPVGAGRRRNKNLASQYRQILVSPEPATRIDIPDSANQPIFSTGECQSNSRSLTSNGTVLKFGPEGGLCESMATALHLRDQKGCASGMDSAKEIRDGTSSCGLVITAPSVPDNQVHEIVKRQSSLPSSCNELTQPNPLQCYPVPPWVFSCNQVWNSEASMVAARCSSEMVSVPDGCNPNPIQLCSTPMLAVPGFCTPSIPLQFVPASYWGCLPVWTAGTRNTPMVGSDGGFSPPSSNSNSCSSNNSPTLGKHSREENSIDEKSEKCVLVPKTLRIHDPDEASKSSIWATLGFESNQREAEARVGIFKPFKSSAECNGHSSDTTQVLEANPAALSRSHTFQESS